MLVGVVASVLQLHLDLVAVDGGGILKADVDLDPVVSGRPRHRLVLVGGGVGSEEQPVGDDVAFDDARVHQLLPHTLDGEKTQDDKLTY